MPRRSHYSPEQSEHTRKNWHRVVKYREELTSLNLKPGTVQALADAFIRGLLMEFEVQLDRKTDLEREIRRAKNVKEWEAFERMTAETEQNKDGNISPKDTMDFQYANTTTSKPKGK